MRTCDFSPLFRSTIGFDRLFDLAETVQRGHGRRLYNIERLADDRYQISLAVAGFSPTKSRLRPQNVVTIEGGKTEKAEREFLYRGISTRHFKRQFSLADYIQVKGATFDNSLLKIELVREIPEAMKQRRIAINGASTADNVHQIEAKAAYRQGGYRASTDARYRTSSKEWRRPCGRRPLSMTMFSTSPRCCTPGPSSIIQETWWRIPRCRYPRSAPFWRPGHPMHRRSRPVPRCGRRQASRCRSPSTRYSKPYANSTGVRAIRRAVSQTACVRRRGPWRRSGERCHG